jgi:hypothetical protein
MPYKNKEDAKEYMRQWRAKKKREKEAYLRQIRNERLEQLRKENPDLAHTIAETNESMRPISPLRPSESPKLTEIVMHEPSICDIIANKGYTNLTMKEQSHMCKCDLCGNRYAHMRKVFEGLTSKQLFGEH